MKCIFCKKEQKKPKFKIGDAVVEPAEYNNMSNDEYLVIFSIQQKGDDFIYNIDYGEQGYGSWCVEDELRKPTKSELSLYFSDK